MSLKLYKIKISIFVNFIIFLMVFLTWIFFIIFDYHKTKSSNYNKLNKIENKIKKMKNTSSIIEQLNNLSLLNIANEVIWNKEKDDIAFLQEHFWTKFINVYEDNLPIYTNFDENNCKENLICKKINKWNYLFMIAITKIKKNFWENILIFGFFSFLISLLFFPVVYWIISKLTKPIEQNFEFMKNFTNNAWHELKTPLANINLSSQILLSKKKFDKELIEQIKTESAKLSNLIDTLLQISILSRFHQKKEKINLKNIIEEVIKNNKNLIKEKNIILETKLDNIEKDINKSQFEILFRNLLSNAIKYNIKNGKIKIILKSNQLIVENTGPNIPPKERKRIFNLFYRLDKKQNWYWLWLALVKKIIDINKWEIKVESKNKVNKFVVKF